MDPNELYQLINTQYVPYVQQNKNKSLKAKSRRVVLAYMKGGRCQECHHAIQDYDNLRSWEFDHYDEIQDQPATADGHAHFRISGSACANHSWEKVQNEAMNYTRLLCYRCHHAKTTERKKALRERGLQTTVQRAASDLSWLVG